MMELETASVKLLVMSKKRENAVLKIVDEVQSSSFAIAMRKKNVNCSIINDNDKLARVIFYSSNSKMGFNYNFFNSTYIRFKSVKNIVILSYDKHLSSLANFLRNYN